MAKLPEKTLSELSAISKRLREQSRKLAKDSAALAAEIARIKKQGKDAASRTSR